MMPLMALTHTVTFNPNLVEFTEATDKSTTISYPEIFNNEIPGHPSLPVQYLKFILPQDSKVEDITLYGTVKTKIITQLVVEFISTE